LLTSDMINGNYQRTDNFRIDNKIQTGSASKSDYYKSGYDRGHLAPAGDMKISKISMSESFLLSNISPQNPSFNSGGWQKLESQVRCWVLSEGEMFIVTGPILRHQIKSIGLNNVSVPSFFYKIVYSKSNNKMIAFVMPNKKTSNDLKYYVKSVDYIEDLTGIDFFYQLDDEIEKELESQINLKEWKFKINKNKKLTKN
jgi:endonuclease G, mitochondrial